MENIFNKLRNLDAYPKVNEDFYNRTISGGVITLLSSIAILLLFFSEFRLYLHTVTETKLLVDTSRGQALQINVVPTIYSDVRGRTVHSNQYSVTEHFVDLNFIHPRSHPGVYFVYDFSPIKVTFKEEHISFLPFITNICAVIGGIFTVARIIDSFVYHGHRTLKKKREIGKVR